MASSEDLILGKPTAPVQCALGRTFGSCCVIMGKSKLLVVHKEANIYDLESVLINGAIYSMFVISVSPLGK